MLKRRLWQIDCLHDTTVQGCISENVTTFDLIERGLRFTKEGNTYMNPQGKPEGDKDLLNPEQELYCLHIHRDGSYGYACDWIYLTLKEVKQWVQALMGREAGFEDKFDEVFKGVDTWGTPTKQFTIGSSKAMITPLGTAQSLSV